MTPAYAFAAPLTDSLPSLRLTAGGTSAVALIWCFRQRETGVALGSVASTTVLGKKDAQRARTHGVVTVARRESRTRNPRLLDLKPQISLLRRTL